MKTKIQTLIASESKVGSIIKTAILLIGFLLSIAWNFNCFGQGTHFMTNGKLFSVEVLAVSSTEVKYKNLENTNGSIYISLKNKINKIIYKNGAVEVITI
jgi:hypothetical protein